MIFPMARSKSLQSVPVSGGPLFPARSPLSFICLLWVGIIFFIMMQYLRIDVGTSFSFLHHRCFATVNSSSQEPRHSDAAAPLRPYRSFPKYESTKDPIPHTLWGFYNVNQFSRLLN